MTDITLVRDLEERMFNAWPALQTIHMDGWLLRMARGHTKRANAASPWFPSDLPTADLIQAVKSLYRKAGIEPMVRITPLAADGVDAALAAAGWTLFDPTKVMVASLAERVKLEGTPAVAVVLAEDPSVDWIEGAAGAYELAEWQRDVLAEIVSSIRVDAAFATIFIGREPVGYGLGVAERGYVGLYDLAVTPAARGQGVGARMVTSLMHWGRSKGAKSAYLQVRDANEKARALYGRLGFADVYGYHCRRPPQS
ncbi:MAG: GNAT family N-acetyltransferase [Rhizobiales bacterium]|nr:GNAT family N-acetyltransferase [Hyphomicrobiales bacterium]